MPLKRGWGKTGHGLSFRLHASGVWLLFNILYEHVSRSAYLYECIFYCLIIDIGAWSHGNDIKMSSRCMHVRGLHIAGQPLQVSHCRNRVQKTKNTQFVYSALSLLTVLFLCVSNPIQYMADDFEAFGYHDWPSVTLQLNKSRQRTDKRISSNPQSFLIL